MSLSPFPALKGLPRSTANTQDLTLRDFSGGLRVSENETNLRNKFSVVADNVFRDEEQGMRVRYGTKLFATCASDILEMANFTNSAIAFMKDGTIAAIDGAGSVVVIWNDTIAGALTASPDGWTAGAEQISYTVFNSDLIVTNGLDKPIVIDNTFAVTYLQDLATGSNVYVPITNLVTTVANYCVMAGYNDTDEVFISSAGTSGTWPGDADPNNSVSIRLGSYTANSGAKIVSIADFKNTLIVFFEEYVLVLELDIFDADGVHTPKVVDTIQDTRLLNHRTSITTNSELVIVTQTGLQTLKPQQFSQQLTTKDFTEDVHSLFEKATATMDLSASNTFMVRDLSAKRIFVFIRQDGVATYEIYAMAYKDNFKDVSWSKVTGWTFDGGIETARGRMLLFKGDKVYLYGNSSQTGEEYHADLITASYAGDAIVWTWELPWFDANSRIRSKQLSNVMLDTVGTARFNLNIFIDNFYTDVAGDPDPVMVMGFRGGSTAGYGTDVGGFGGGRRTNDERAYKMPSKFNILKFQFTGATFEELKFSAISVMYRKAQGFRR